MILLTGCTQIILTTSTVEGSCNNIQVSDDRAVNQNGLIHNDPIMGITTMQFTPPLAESARRNICHAIEVEGLETMIEFSITDLQCSSRNGVIEGYLSINGNDEERVRAIATTENPGIQIATVCGFAISDSLEVLATQIAEIASETQ